MHDRKKKKRYVPRDCSSIQHPQRTGGQHARIVSHTHIDKIGRRLKQQRKVELAGPPCGDLQPQATAD